MTLNTVHFLQKCLEQKQQNPPFYKNVEIRGSEGEIKRVKTMTIPIAMNDVLLEYGWYNKGFLEKNEYDEYDIKYATNYLVVYKNNDLTDSDEYYGYGQCLDGFHCMSKSPNGSSMERYDLEDDYKGMMSAYRYVSMNPDTILYEFKEKST